MSVTGSAQRRADLFNRLEKLAQAFECDELALQRHEDGVGRAWNTRAVWCKDGDGEDDFEHMNGEADVRWKQGTRHAQSAIIKLTDDFGKPAGTVEFDPIYEFQMMGLGYTHPKWSHGLLHGELTVEREDIVLAKVDPQLPFNLHVQALSHVTFTDAAGKVRKGRGVLEQLVMGPHAPSGFKAILDFAG